MHNFYTKIFSDFIVTALGRYLALIVQFIVTMILARILIPEDYGTIGILTVFTSISLLLVDSGFGQALIQKDKVLKEDYSSVFYFNLLFSVFLYFFLFWFSSFISIFYNDDRLIYLSRILFLSIPISSLGIINLTILQKRRDFFHLALIQVLSAIFSGIIGVFFALKGYGIISLVYQVLSLNLCKTLLAFYYSKWSPVLKFSIYSITSIASFSFNLLFTSLIKVVFHNIYTLIIGKISTSADVGYYNQAKRLEELTSNTIVDVIIAVTYPSLVTIKSDKQKLRTTYSLIIKIAVFLIAPLLSFLIFYSEQIVVLVFSVKWLPAVPYFELLCIYGLTLPLHLINNNILKVFAKGKDIVKIEIFRRILIMLSILLTFKSGVSMMLVGQIIATLPVIVVSMFVSGKLIDYSVFRQISHVVPFYLFSFATYFIFYFLINALSVQFNLFWGLIYFVFNYLLFTITYYTLFHKPSIILIIESIKRTINNKLLHH